MKLKIFTLLLIIGILFFSTVKFTETKAQTVNKFPALSTSANICNGGNQPLQINSLTDNQQIDKEKDLWISGIPTTAKTVLFWANDQVLGQAKRDTANAQNWYMTWDPSFSDPGPKNIMAQILFDNDGCMSAARNVNVVSPTQNFVNTRIINKDILTNSTLEIEIDLDSNSGGVSKYEEFAYIYWKIEGNNLGYISKLPDGRAKYYSPNPGTTKATATIFYGGRPPILQEFNIKVFSPTTNTIEDSSGTSSGGTETNDSTDSIKETSTDDSEDEELKVVENPKELIQRVLSDDTIEQCFNGTIGEDAIKRIIDENRRPNTAEFASFLKCFEKQNFVIPSILSPVDPAVVKEVKESKLVKLNTIRNEKKIDELGEEKTVLVLSGTTEPNRNVILYVFSEPLVLATTSDGDGNWTYTLEDPLEGGEHEVYALVENGNGEYERSSVASFLIGTAEASEENPNGYSLELAGEPTIAASNRSVNILVAATIGMITFIACLLFGFLFLKFKRGKDKIDPDVPNDTDGNLSNFTKTL